MNCKMKHIVFVVTLLISSTSVFSQSCTPPGTFTLNNVSSSNNLGTSVNLSWGVSANANDGYDVYYKLTTASSWTRFISTRTTTTTKTLTGLSYGTNYNIYVEANRSCSSDSPENPISFNKRDSAPITISTKPRAPGIQSATSVTTDSFRAHWTSVSGTSGYVVHVSTSPLFTVHSTYNVSSSSLNITGLATALHYYYRVSAVNSGGESEFSDFMEVYTKPTAPESSAPTLQSQTSFRANWSSVTRADSYRLDVSTLENFSSIISEFDDFEVSGTTKTVTGLETGKTYYYRVRAYDSAGGTISANSSVQSALTIPANPPSSSATSVSQNSFRANWSNVSGETGYLLDVSETEDFSTDFPMGYPNKMVTGTSLNVTGLQPGKTYYYRVRSTNGSGASGYSTSRTVLLKPANPVALSATSLESHQITARWTANAIVPDSYLVDVSLADDFSSFVYRNQSTSATTINISGLDGGTIYYYRIKARNDAGDSEYSIESEALTIPEVPGVLAASSLEQHAFIARWNPVAGETGYLLDVSESSTFEPGSFIVDFENLSVTENAQPVDGLTAGKTYYYRVRSRNSSGSSDNSNHAGALLKPANPVGTTTANIQSNQFTAIWTANTITPEAYLIDVSEAEDFSSFVHQDLLSTSSSKEIIGLNGGTTYYYRIRAQNKTGISGYSDPVELLTMPNPPTITTATDIQPNSFIANWNAEPHATAYYIDVSDTELFSNFIDGYHNLSLTGTSLPITGLTPGTTYYYRVRVKNNTGTSSSAGNQILTVSPPPVIAPTSHITATGFDAHWEVTKGAESYFFDLSEQPNFGTFVEGYQQLEVEGDHELRVTSLAPGTLYYYRLKSANTSGQSLFSSTESLMTTPEKTAIVAFTENAANKFKVSWESQQGVDKYEIFVAEDLDFNQPVAGNYPLTATLTEAFCEGLQPNTIYYVKVRSFNEGGTSVFSEIKTTSTTDTDGSIVFPSIGDLAINTAENMVSWNVTGGTGGIGSVLFLHKKITENSFTQEVLELSDEQRYHIQIQDDWKDAFGMQYAIYTEDLAGRIDESSVEVLQNHHDHVEVALNESFGTDISNYQIISIPHELATTRIQDLFESVLGSYDNTKWRLLRYIDQDKGYVDYADGLSVANVQRGAGYWFISNKEVSLQFGPGQAPSNTLSEPFILTLQKGWNQIGNPFLEEISWQAVLEVNDNPEVVGDYKVYESGSSSFEESDIMKVYGGGFVFADAEISLLIPVDINTINTGARIRPISKKTTNADLIWRLPITLTQGNVSNTTAAIGMSTHAVVGKDPFDDMRAPQLGQIPEMYTVHKDFFYSDFSEDIVKPSDLYFWDFEVKSSSHETLALSWEANPFDQGSLILYDLKNNALVNMNQTSSYSIEGGHRVVRIFYSKQPVPLGTNLQLGHAYPNPTVSQIQFDYGFHLGSEPSQAVLSIYDLSGTQISLIEHEELAQGVRSLQWNGKTAKGERAKKGMYLYTIEASTYGRNQTTKGKIIIQ